MAEKTPVYVAGLERGVRPMGDWSIWMTLSSWSMPMTRGFSAAADSGNDRHDAEREVDGEVFEVVGVGVFNGDPIVGEFAWSGAGEDFDFACEVLAG
jgi:hypothetical protein